MRAAASAPIAQAVRAGDVPAARELLRRHVDLNEPLPDGSTLLAWAVESQSGEMVRLLLDHGAKANGVGDVSVAPLFIACQYGDPVILGALLDKHADVRVTRPDGITPLSVCAGNAPAGILERMIRAGAAVDVADNAGQTPLMWAAALGRIDNIRLLVAQGAKVNGKSAKGFTPLFFSLKSHVAEAPIALLNLGADAGYVAPDGTSSVQLAMYQKDYAFAEQMISRGANLSRVRSQRQSASARRCARQSSAAGETPAGEGCRSQRADRPLDGEDALRSELQERRLRRAAETATAPGCRVRRREGDAASGEWRRQAAVPDA